MLQEVETYSTLLGLAGPFDEQNRLVNDVMVTEKNYDPKVASKRPPGWSDLRLKRVLAKEKVDRSNGVSDVDILESRPQTIIMIEMSMMKEATDFGCALGK